jgi:hypothetical protein
VVTFDAASVTVAINPAAVHVMVVAFPHRSVTLVSCPFTSWANCVSLAGVEPSERVRTMAHNCTCWRHMATFYGRSTSHWPTSRHRLGQPDEAHFRACGCRWGAEVLGWKEVTGEKLSRPSPQSPFRDSQPTPPRYGNVCTPTAKCEPT